MNVKPVTVADDSLEAARANVKKKEAALQKVVARFCRAYPGSLRELAGKLGVSAAYLSDIRAGKRKVSARMVEKLRRLM